MGGVRSDLESKLFRAVALQKERKLETHRPTPTKTPFLRSDLFPIMDSPSTHLVTQIRLQVQN